MLLGGDGLPQVTVKDTQVIDEAEEDVFESGDTIDVSSMPDWGEDQVRSFLHDVEDCTILDRGLDLTFISLICSHAPLGNCPAVADGLLLFIGRLMDEYPDCYFNDLIRKILDQIHEAARRSDQTSKSSR